MYALIIPTLSQSDLCVDWHLFCFGLCFICGHDNSTLLLGRVHDKLWHIWSWNCEEIDELVWLLRLRFRSCLAFLCWVQHYTGCSRSLRICRILCGWYCWIQCKLKLIDVHKLYLNLEMPQKNLSKDFKPLDQLH